MKIQKNKKYKTRKKNYGIFFAVFQQDVKLFFIKNIIIEKVKKINKIIYFKKHKNKKYFKNKMSNKIKLINEDIIEKIYSEEKNIIINEINRNIINNINCNPAKNEIDDLENILENLTSNIINIKYSLAGRFVNKYKIN